MMPLCSSYFSIGFLLWLDVEFGCLISWVLLFTAIYACLLWRFKSLGQTFTKQWSSIFNTIKYKIQKKIFELFQQVFLIKQTWPQSWRMRGGWLILIWVWFSPSQTPSPHGKSTIGKPAGHRKTSHISPLGKRRSTDAKWVNNPWSIFLG